MRKRMSAFEIFLRTGRRVADEPEGIQTKFNPWHDPEDGRFTFAGQGRHFGGGHTGSGEATAGTRRVPRRARVQMPTASARPAPKLARPSPKQDSATFLESPKEAMERIRRELAATRNVSPSKDVVQRFKQHMIPEEGDRNDVYLDNRGIPTVGIGHKVVPSDKLKVGDRISDARKEEFWRQDSSKALDAAQKQMKTAGIADPNFVGPLA